MDFREFPTPEELFEQTWEDMEPVTAVRRVPVPGYKVKKNYTLCFILIILLLAAAYLWLDHMGISYYHMDSGSMERLIPKGSFLIEREIAADSLKKGDIITFYNEEGISVTHQIKKIIKTNGDGQDLEFQTKGSDNASPDKDYVTEEQITGKVIFHIPFLGYLFSAVQG